MYFGGPAARRRTIGCQTGFIMGMNAVALNMLYIHEIKVRASCHNALFSMLKCTNTALLLSCRLTPVISSYTEIPIIGLVGFGYPAKIFLLG